MQLDIYGNAIPQQQNTKHNARTIPEKNYAFESSKPLNEFSVVEHYSLTPNSLAIYNRVYRNSTKTHNSNKEQKEKLYFDSNGNITLQAPENNQKNHHNFELSKQARKNLRSKVTWLYHFAKKQTIITKKGKFLSNFKMNFVTLKLPSEQIHTSDFITKNCLNQLLTEIKGKYTFENYVWRLEYQKNGNLHYHIATDTYIDYHWLLRTWNRILNKYGYVDLYTRKFQTLSIMEYIKSQGYGDKTDFKIMAERYAKGCREGWKNPNTVDVKAVFGKSNIAFYISKYMAKKPEEGTTITLPVCEQNSANSRLWFCSRSLSQCKTESDVRDAQEIDIYSLLINLDVVKSIYCDYCTVIYFDLDKLPALIQGVINTRLELYRQRINYNVPMNVAA